MLCEIPTLADIYRTIKNPALIVLKDKAPVEKKWQNTTFDDTQSVEYQRKLKRSTNIGTVLGERSGGLCTIDCDTDPFLKWSLEHNLELAGSLRVVGARAAQIYFYVEGDRPTKVYALKVYKTSPLAVGAKHPPDKQGMVTIGEFRAEGGQSVLVGIHPESKRPYHWPIDNPPITIAFDRIVWHPDIDLPWASHADGAKSHSTSFGGNGNGDHEADEGGNEALQEAMKIVTIDFLWKYFGFPPRVDANGHPLNPGLLLSVTTTTSSTIRSRFTLTRKQANKPLRISTLPIRRRSRATPTSSSGSQLKTPAKHFFLSWRSRRH